MIEKMIDNKDLLMSLKDTTLLGKPIYLSLSGESMLPTIKNKEVVRIEPVNSLIKAGDIVLYEDAQSMPIVHRVIGIKKDDCDLECLIRADNQLYLSEYIKRKQIIGRISCVRIKGRDVLIERFLFRRLRLFLKIRIRNILGSLGRGALLKR